MNKKCPCNETCCDNFKEISWGHVCNEDCERICEEKYRSDCANCGASCYCDL